MAYYGGGANAPLGGNAFGGFAGGYNQTPGGIIPNANGNLLGSGGVITMGNSLSSVDPNNFPGTVHFGPSTTTMGTPGAQYLPGTGFVDPNLGLGGGANFNSGF